MQDSKYAKYEKEALAKNAEEEAVNKMQNRVLHTAKAKPLDNNETILKRGSKNEIILTSNK